MNTCFTDTRYGLTEEVDLMFHRYVNGGVAIVLWSQEHGPWLKATLSIDKAIPADCVAVKNHAENHGVVELLIKNGVIESQPVDEISSGHVNVPIHKLTPDALLRANVA